MHSYWFWWHSPELEYSDLARAPCLEYRIRACLKLEFVSRTLEVWLSGTHDACKSNVSRSSVHNNESKWGLYLSSSQSLPTHAFWIAIEWCTNLTSRHADR